MLPERRPIALTLLNPRQNTLGIVVKRVVVAGASITQALKVIIDAT
jgi:hypothetical protein